MVMDHRGRMITKKYQVPETKGEKFQEAAISSAGPQQTAGETQPQKSLPGPGRAKQQAAATGRRRPSEAPSRGFIRPRAVSLLL